MRNGSVAQLNRASDYGSEGYGFESRRSHKRFHENYKGIKIEKEDVIHLTSSFSVYARHEYYLTGASPGSNNIVVFLTIMKLFYAYSCLTL